MDIAGLRCWMFNRIGRQSLVPAVALLAGQAAAQDYTYLLTVDYGAGESSVHPGNPEAIVRVFATLKESDWAWARGDLNILATEAGWSSFDLEFGTHGLFGHSRGELSANQRSVVGIFTGQFNNGTGFTNRDHPLLIWEGVWSNLSSDFSRRTVDLDTDGTTQYRVFVTDTAISTDVLPVFVPGAGQIVITPSPAPVALLAVVAAFARRRR